LYAALPVGVGFLDPGLRYLRVNEALAAINGRPVPDHIGSPLEDVVGERAAAIREALERVIATREARRLTVEAALEDGSGVRAIEAMYFPVLDEDDQLLGVGAVVRDVTEQRGLEEAQARSLQEAVAARADAEAARTLADEARRDAELGRARVALLAEAGRVMAQSLDWESTLRAVVRSAVPAVADWTSLTMSDPTAGLRVVAVAHRDPELEAMALDFLERYPRDPDAPSGPAHVIRTGQLEVVEDLTPEAIRSAARGPEHLRMLERLNLRHYVIAPLKTPDGVVGALTFVLGDSGRRFELADLELITSLAARAALHVQSARLYAERSHIADVLQASLRPRPLPEVPAVDLAGRFRPAGDYIDAGGDFYEVFRSGDRVWTALVGDVSGKGPEAAAVTALARHTLRTASLLHDDPGANLALLNRTLSAESEQHRICTVFYVRLCPGEDGVDCRFANGGHPPPLILRPDGSVEAVQSGRGPLLGAYPDAGYEEATLHLDPGDLLLMYTDGVTEIRPADPQFGEGALLGALARCAGRSAEAVVRAIEQHTVELQAGSPRDDIALLAIKARSAAATPET
jgi:serine phosphatase RsbU (regulator of sigma subunit)